jgi:hypothetical protein
MRAMHAYYVHFALHKMECLHYIQVIERRDETRNGSKTEF